MTWPQPTRQAHEKFCLVEGWIQVRDARELHLSDGRILRTRISHPVDRTTYGASIWSHILRHQLDVTDEAFWRCVQEGTKPDRGEPEVPSEALPVELVYLLINRVGVDEAVVRAMTKDEAVARLNQYWAEGA